MTRAVTEIENLAINAIRFLAVDAVEQAQSGHPGAPMGLAPVAYVLWHEFLKHNPQDPTWPDRDRFVLSAGHASMLLYSLLHLSGYDLPLEELKRFRQWGSRTPGHPEYGHTPGVEVTTGPLGQGISTAVGMALAEKKLAAEFNREGLRIVDHYTYVIASDGDLMEGVASEASSLAGHWGLGKLIVIWDDNRVSIDGSTDLAFREDVLQRYAAYGWHTLRVEDGNDLDALRDAIRKARAETERPTLIAVRTHIGYGSPKQDSAEAHGAPLGPEAVAAAREALGWPYAPFEVPEAVYVHMRQAVEKGMAAQEVWEQRLEAYLERFPELGTEFVRRVIERRLPEGWDAEMPRFTPGAKVATRKASGQVLAAIAPRLPELVGGSADLTPSNNTQVPGMEDFTPERPTGRYVHYGVREHAMGAIMNGLCLHGGYRPYGGTFLIFSDYMRPPVRLAALMGVAPIYVWTHDSIGLGEDGPTHQPVEHLMGLRAMPNLWVIRPADATEVPYAWKLALERTDGPVGIVLTRQGLPVIDRERYAAAEGVLRGGYVLADAPRPDAVIVATGSEVHLALAARERLQAEGVAVRVVSLPCWEVFEQQDAAYRLEVLPPEVPTLAVEAGVALGWERYADAVVSLERFGASAPGGVLFERFGFTVERVVARVRELLGAAHG
ncbi:transketolase [Marinithermus hydrothermalis]|uniref:Transketolase n=1 Tax=Marinithermus hydrothermalis (strain DSM 14884 / JCM 11576 / T1) TaxID=869210 RepID=F2NNX4_MARHT|nr:transketolase [Marinithermus hydrothermalis]AEB11562.1 transketolase [Marinithermus hydrothermalis DSM 14884]